MPKPPVPDNATVLDSDSSATSDLYRAAMGSMGADYYSRVFARLDSDERARLGWNWAASLITLNWMAYRQLWGAALAYVGALVAAVLLVVGIGRLVFQFSSETEMALLAGIALLSFVVPGLLGNSLMFKAMRGKVEAALAANTTLPEAAAMLRGLAITRRRAVVLGVANAVLAGVALALYLNFPSVGNLPMDTAKMAQARSQASGKAADLSALPTVGKPSEPAKPEPPAAATTATATTTPTPAPAATATPATTPATTPASTPASSPAGSSASSATANPAGSTAAPSSASGTPAASGPSGTTAPSRPSASGTVAAPSAAAVAPGPSAATSPPPSTPASAAPTSTGAASGTPPAPTAVPATPVAQANTKPEVPPLGKASPVKEKTAKPEAKVAVPALASKGAAAPTKESSKASSKTGNAPESPPAPAVAAKATPTSTPARTATAAPEAAAPGKPSQYLVNVGLFADTNNARNVFTKLTDASLPATSLEFNTSKGKRTRVRVGPFETQVEADRSAEKVRSLGLEAEVIRQP